MSKSFLFLAENLLSEFVRSVLDFFGIHSLEVDPADIPMNRLKQLEKRSTKPVYGVLIVGRRLTRIS